VRVEFYGDLVMSIKAFDPEHQRTVAEAPEVWLTPAREAVLTAANVERARERVRAACDAVDWPSSKARAVVDDVASGRAFFGAEGFLPAFVELAPLSTYLPEDAAIVLEDPTSITRSLRDEVGRAASDQMRKAREPHFGIADFYEPEVRIARWIAA